MTRRRGKSFGKLLISRAVEMAVGLAGAGGGKVWRAEERRWGGRMVGFEMEEVSLPWPVSRLVSGPEEVPPGLLFIS